MVQLGDFDPRQQEASTGVPDPIPPGDYTFIVKDSTVKTTKDQKGQYLAMTYEVVDGTYKGRQVFANFNLINQSAEAVRIAKAELTALFLACGKHNPVKDSTELHGIPFKATVIVQPADPKTPQYGPQNRIKKYHFEKSGSTPAASAPATPGISGQDPMGSVGDDDIPF